MTEDNGTFLSVDDAPIPAPPAEPAPARRQKPAKPMEATLTDAEREAFGDRFADSVRMGMDYTQRRDAFRVSDSVRSRYPSCEFYWPSLQKPHGIEDRTAKGYVPVPDAPDIQKIPGHVLMMTHRSVVESKIARQREDVNVSGKKIQDEFDKSVISTGGLPKGRISGPGFYPSEADDPNPQSEYQEFAEWKRAKLGGRGRSVFAMGRNPLGG